MSGLSFRGILPDAKSLFFGEEVGAIDNLKVDAQDLRAEVSGAHVVRTGCHLMSSKDRPPRRFFFPCREKNNLGQFHFIKFKNMA